MFKEVKDYKSACKVLGIKPIDKRRKLDEDVVTYIQLTTIIKAVNFIANDRKIWKFDKNKPRYEIRSYSIHGSSAGMFFLHFYGSTVDVNALETLKTRKAGEYIIENFHELLMKYYFGS